MPIVNTGPVSSTMYDEKRSYLVPLIMVTSLFFLWGLANILNSTLIAHFQPVFEISRAEALLVETAFYLGYFTIAIPAGLFMEKFSYKKGLIMGLLLYAIGALLFIPAAKTLTFGFFLMALYIIASGLAFLETGANPYVILLGKPETGTVRLNTSQTFNGLALIVGPLIAGEFIFSGNEGNLSTLAEKQQAADAVILPYATIGFVVLFVALLFALIKMPEPDKGQGIKFDKNIFKKKHLMLGVFTQFMYVGAQVGVWGLTIDVITDVLPDTSREVASKVYFVSGTLLFVVGRVFGTFLMRFVKTERLLSFYGGSAMVLCLLAAFGTGNVAVFALLGINFFMSIMFPTIFALGIKDLGDNAKLGSSLIIMAIVGGAVLPPIMGLVTLKFEIQHALLIPAVSFLVVLYYGWKGYLIKS